MQKNIWRVAFVTLMLASLVNVQAQEADADWKTALKSKLTISLSAATRGQLTISSITETPLNNLVEIELSTGEVLFSDKSGDFLLSGDMFETSPAGLRNLSAERRQSKNADIVASIPVEEMIIFSPESVIASVTVFTDVDCTYCRKLHGDMETLMDLGIQLKYVAYPRGGKDAGSYDKMVSVWCSEDRNKRLTQAKNGQNIPDAACESPVLEHYLLGNKIGISGTPALVLPSGKVVPGYLEPKALLDLLISES